MINIRFAKLAVAAGVAAAAIVTGVTPANAESSHKDHGLSVAQAVFSAANPHAAFNKLSDADRADFNAVELPAASAESVTATGTGANAGMSLTGAQARALLSARVGRRTAAFAGCWAMTDTGSTTAAAGNTLYTYWQATQVCVSSSRVTSITVYNVGQETSTPGWRVDKAATKQTYNVSWEGRGLAQYYFVLGVAGWDVSHPTTCLQGRLNANGYSNAWSTSCNLN